MFRVLSFHDFVDLCKKYRDFWSEFSRLNRKSWLLALRIQRYFQICPVFAVWLSQPYGRVYKTEITFASRVLEMNYLADPRRSSKWQNLYRTFESFCINIKESMDYEISTFSQEKKSEEKKSEKI